MKYPFDIVSHVRTNKTFSVEARFSQETEESPLKVFNHFSRFVATIIQEKKALTCNIQLEHLAEIKKNTDFAYNRYLETKTAVNTDSEHNTPAYTEKFNTGALKGMSAAEVLVKKPDGKELLREQYSFLKKNLEKFPGNQKLMDAIKEVSKYEFEDVKNALGSISSYAPMTIYEIGVRPLIRKTREDGKCLCYECKATWDYAKNYPVSFVIKNYYAPFEKKEGGTINVNIKQKDAEVIHEFSMTASEWLDTVEKMSMAMNAYYMINFNKGLKMAEDYEASRRKNNENEPTASAD